jgi:hypothetical protein
MRFAAGLALLLAACSPSASTTRQGDLVACALGGATRFSHDCSVERSEQNGDPVLVVHHPDGGFRRFALLDGGRSVGVADGAQALAVAGNGEWVDVAVDDDRYRFPAKMLSDAARR